MSKTKVTFAIIGGILALAVLAVAPWLIRVATSETAGQGNAIIMKNSAENWTAAQAEFEGLYAEIVATDRKIAIAEEALALAPEDKTNRDILQGVKSACVSIVGDYNAKARTFLAENFRSADLPAQISDLDATTDCK